MERLSFPCASCGKLTELIDLSRFLFFCDTVCSKEPVIRSTRDIRRRPGITCPLSGDQKCHIFGLNAAKVIFNHYGMMCQRIDEETLKALIIAINQSDNIYCCSVEQNVRDKKTEEDFLDVFIYKRKVYCELSEESKEMYRLLKAVFGKMQERIGTEHSSVIDTILQDFEALASQEEV